MINVSLCPDPNGPCPAPVRGVVVSVGSLQVLVQPDGGLPRVSPNRYPDDLCAGERVVVSAYSDFAVWHLVRDAAGKAIHDADGPLLVPDFASATRLFWQVSRVVQ